MMPVRIQRSRAKGWKMPEGAVYVGRPTDFGNPFPVDVYGQDGAVDRFRRWLTTGMSAYEMSTSSRCDPYSNRVDPPSLVIVRRWLENGFPKLRGKDLACWCPLDQPCHADVLLEIANL